MISTFLIWQVYKPLQYLRDLSISVSKGEFVLSREKFWFVEFDYLIDVFFTMAHAIKQQLSVLEALSSIDSLTKLYNRRAFDKFFNAILIKSNMGSALGMRYDFAVVMLDIDNFKSINDTYGHDIGDKVLIEIANAIIGRKRSTDIAGRYGGEEFIIILDNIANKLDALKFCLDLKNIISKIEIYIDDERKINVTASFGISFYPDEATDKEALIKIADDNLYNSKRKGKNRVSCIIDSKIIDFVNIEDLYNFLV
jgi:diguanylate cyclase (GGDEF)-like protein